MVRADTVDGAAAGLSLRMGAAGTRPHSPRARRRDARASRAVRRVDADTTLNAEIASTSAGDGLKTVPYGWNCSYSITSGNENVGSTSIGTSPAASSADFNVAGILSYFANHASA